MDKASGWSSIVTGCERWITPTAHITAVGQVRPKRASRSAPRLNVWTHLMNQVLLKAAPNRRRYGAGQVGPTRFDWARLQPRARILRGDRHPSRCWMRLALHSRRCNRLSPKRHRRGGRSRSTRAGDGLAGRRSRVRHTRDRHLSRRLRRRRAASLGTPQRSLGRG